MGRLLGLIFLLAAAAAVAVLAVGVARAAMRGGGDGQTGPGGPMMARVSFLLLVALILYAAIWGGG